MESLLMYKIIISCEHATNNVPKDYQALFSGQSEVLNSHRGWDPGAIVLASAISKNLKVPLFSYPYTRLLIEPNRSLKHPKLYSEFSKNLSQERKDQITRDYYLPYRKRVEDMVQQQISNKKMVLHLSIHSFVPELSGKLRDFEIGILYDPKRETEKEFGRAWKKSILNCVPHYRIRMNQPYKGSSDGFTTHLRKNFNSQQYLGIELEVNQKIISRGKLLDLFTTSLLEIIRS